MPTDGENATSAFVGDPPNTQRDFYIVRGLFRALGLDGADPAQGYYLVAQRPDGTGAAGPHQGSKRAGILAGMVIVILAIVVPTVARLVLRGARKSLQFGSDDVAIAAASLVAVVYPILQILMVVYGGGGVHTWEVNYAQYALFVYLGVVCKVVFYVAVGLIKVSIVLFLRRLTDQFSRRWSIFCDIFLALSVAFIVVALFWTVFMCDPARAMWDTAYSGRLASPAACGDPDFNGAVLGYTHMALSLVLFVSPIAILWAVRLDGARKARLFVIWAVGGLSVLSGFLRIFRKNYSRDYMWDYTEILCWTCLDLSFGVLTACLPVLDGLLAGAWRAGATRLKKKPARGNERAVPPTPGVEAGSEIALAKGGGRKSPPNAYPESIEPIMCADDGFEMSNVSSRDRGVEVGNCKVQDV